MKLFTLPIVSVCLLMIAPSILSAQVIDQDKSSRLSNRFRPISPGGKTLLPSIKDSTKKASASQANFRITDPYYRQETDESLSELEQDLEKSAADESLLENDQDDDLDLELDLEPVRSKAPTREPFGMWPRKSIRDIRVNIVDYGQQKPSDRSTEMQSSFHSQWTAFQSAPKVFAWAAPNIRYQPLYFEDVALERYGQTFECQRFGLQKQELASFAHFFKSAVLLPYQMTFDPPKSCDHPLGYCRPGNRVPYIWQKHLMWGR